MQVRKNQVPGGWIIKYGKIKYDCAGVENASTEKWSTIELGWKMQVQTVQVKSKHNNSPIILRSGKQLSPFLPRDAL